MTNLKLEILKLLYNTYPLREASAEIIYNSISENPIYIKNAIDELNSIGYINKFPNSNMYKLTDLGANTYENFNEFREQNSKREKENRINIRLTIFTLIVSFITLIKEIIFWLFNIS